jgi:hypothetical protein
MTTQLTKLLPRVYACLLALGCVEHCLAAERWTPTEIIIPGEKVYPESLTTSPEGDLIIGSIGARTIYRVKHGAAVAEPWIKPAAVGAQGVFGVLADPKSNTLWACASSLPGTDGLSPQPGVLHAFDLKTGKPRKRYPIPTAGSFCNDIAIGPDGTAYVSNTTNMEILRLKPGARSLEVWAGNGAFGPTGGILDGISVLGDRVLGNTLETGKLFGVPVQPDGTAGPVTEIKLDRPLDRPDGMRTFGTNGLLIIESGGKGTLSRITLDGNTGTVTTLATHYPDGPVAVSVIDTTAYVLEGQLAILFGKRPPDMPPRPFKATAIYVGQAF